MSSDSKPHTILKAREYTDSNGEVKTDWTRLGVAFPNSKGGFNCEIMEGVTLYGKFVILPRSDRNTTAEGNGE